MSAVTPIPLQQRYWNQWNASTREKAIDERSIRQAKVVCEWLSALGRMDLNIIEVGCGVNHAAPQPTSIMLRSIRPRALSHSQTTFACLMERSSMAFSRCEAFHWFQ